MDSKDIRNLQEAYMKGYQELDEAERPLPYGRMMKKSDELADSDDKKKRTRAAKIYLAANAPKGPKVKVRKEQADIYDIILSHLLDEGYAETPEAAEKIMVHMSEEWRESIVEEENLQEMRKEDKVAGKQKTPLTVPGKRSTIQRAPEGSQRKWEKITPKVGNPTVSSGRYRQGAQGGSELGYKRHPHGGEHGGMRKGSMRGVSRMDTQQARRVGPTITPAEKVAQRRAYREQQLRNQQLRNY